MLNYLTKRLKERLMTVHRIVVVDVLKYKISKLMIIFLNLFVIRKYE